MKMKTNAKLFSVGFLVIGLLDGVGLTTIAQPASQSRKVKHQPAEDRRTKASGFTVIGDGCTALASADGAIWSCRQSQSETNCHGMACGNGIFVKVRHGN